MRSRRLTWTSRGLSLDAMDTFNRMLAVRETLAHLDVLVLLGELQVNSTSDVAHYELPTGHAGSAPLRLVDRISNEVLRAVRSAVRACLRTNRYQVIPQPGSGGAKAGDAFSQLVGTDANAHRVRSVDADRHRYPKVRDPGSPQVRHPVKRPVVVQLPCPP